MRRPDRHRIPIGGRSCVALIRYSVCRVLNLFTVAKACCVSLVLTSLIVLTPVRADDLALRDAASMTGTAMFLNSGAPGLIIAVVRGDDSFVAGFGETALGNKTEPDGQSIFRLGSVSKVFATDVLAKLVAQGRVGLTDPLSRHAPDGAVVKSFADKPFTLLDLATHSAGLPRELRDPSVKEGDGNPFLAFETDYYWKWTSEHSPAYAPGTTAMYSNYGYGLLGEALSRVLMSSNAIQFLQRMAGLAAARSAILLSPACQPISPRI